MKNYVLMCTGKGQVELQNFEIADPAEDEIQVEIHASVISPGTERSLILGMRDTPVKYPVSPGYSSAGVVQKTGKHVKEFNIGDRVAGHGISHRSVGNIKAKNAIKIPDSVPFEKAAFLSLGVIAIQGVRKARIELGEEVMILGLGLIGQLAAQMAAINGSLPTIGVDLAESRLEKARECGINIVINSSATDWRERLLEATDGRGPKVVIESTGFPEVIGMSLETVQDFGRVVVLGSTRGESTVNFYKDVHKKGVTVIGAHVSTHAEYESRPGIWTWQDNAKSFVKLLQGNRICLEPLITERIHWDKMVETYKEMLSWNKNMIGTLIQWKDASEKN